MRRDEEVISGTGGDEDTGGVEVDGSSCNISIFADYAANANEGVFGLTKKGVYER